MAASEEGLTWLPEMGSMAVSEMVGFLVVSEVGLMAASGLGGLIQHQIFLRTAVWVSSKQRFGVFGHPESYPAAPTQGIWSSFSNVFSSFGKIRPCQGLKVHTYKLLNYLLNLCRSLSTTIDMR